MPSVTDRLNILRNISETENMDETNYIIKDSDFHLIPTFDGSSDTLVDFIDSINLVFEYSCNANNTHRVGNHQRLLAHVRNKLIGKARSCKKYYTNIGQLLNDVKKKFRDTKSIEKSICEIYETKPHYNEHPLMFIDRLMILREDLSARIRTNDEFTLEQKNAKMSEYDLQIATHCKRHLHPELNAQLIHVKYETLEDIEQFIKRETDEIIERIYDKPQKRTPQIKPQSNYKGRNFDPNHYKRYERREQQYEIRNNYQPNYHRERYEPRQVYQPGYQGQERYYAQRQEPYNTQQDNHRQIMTGHHYQRNDNAQYNQSWKPHEQRKYFNPQPTQEQQRGNQTVSMRTASNRVHYTENDKDGEIRQLKEQINELSQKFEHFLEIGHDNDPPPDQSMH